MTDIPTKGRVWQRHGAGDEWWTFAPYAVRKQRPSGAWILRKSGLLLSRHDNLQDAMDAAADDAARTTA